MGSVYIDVLLFYIIVMAICKAHWTGVITVTTAFVVRPSSPIIAMSNRFSNYGSLNLHPLNISPLKNHHLQHHSTDPTSPKTVAFEFNLGGNSVIVELSTADDIPTKALQLVSQFGNQLNPLDIQQMLQESWDIATSRDAAAAASPPPYYNGPTPLPETLWKAECTIELLSGLVLELGPSTIGETAGIGIFVRQSSSAPNPILQTQGSAFCGYGPCQQITDSLAGLSDYQRQRTFEFVLTDGLESYVWFDNKLQTVWDVMQQSQAKSVRSHILEYNEDEERIILTPDKTCPCYLIPPTDPLDIPSITIHTIGHMCNDLAGGWSMSKEDYDAASHENNLLVLVPRVRVQREDGVLEPSGMPILTLARTIVVANTDLPMEVGLRYGQAYWQNETM
jgi:hypothetical protein